MVRKFRTELSGERKYRTEPLITAFQLKKQINLSVTRELSLIDLGEALMGDECKTPIRLSIKKTNNHPLKPDDQNREKEGMRTV